ncbi:GDSL-type esterase/lipase family protein [Rhodohalobacter sp. 8-1]|uniref:GDSL-type esterase/lipase family protein n=1 Tax=Rhodohalobacter sp. 8-1 TaxID=3131972 RepID=UPI0030EBD875
MRLLAQNIFALILLSICIPTADAFSQVNCPEDATALTPAPLEEEWAIEWWMPRHESKLTEEGRETADVLFLGDSITHGWETTGKAVAEEYFSGFSIYNIGYSGDRTENVLWRFDHGEIDGINPKLAVVMIGTNNTGHRQDSPECTARGIEMILNELGEKLPDTEVLLLAIFPRGETAGNELRQLNTAINQRIESFADGERVHFMNINSVFLDEDENLPEEIMPDQLHPNEYGYELWAKVMLPAIREFLD